MTMATTLTEAAYLSYDQCGIHWNAGVLRDAFSEFLPAASAIFSDSRPDDRPVGNWLVPMYALLTQVEAASPESQRFLDSCVQYLYRICYAGYVMRQQGLITNAQAVSLLAAWNAHIGS
jgi:hypothetical protein